MKKQFFTFLMMIALVIVAGSAMAQVNKGTVKYPYTGSLYTYTVGSLDNDDDYVFSINQSTTDPEATLAGTHYTVDATSSLTGVVSSSQAVLKITWSATSANGTYRLWISLTDDVTSCTNFRYVTVYPQDPVDWRILVMGVDKDVPTLAANATAATVGNICIDESIRFDYEWDDENATPKDGAVFVYFRVERLNGNDNNSWYATVNSTNNSSAVSTTIEYADSWGGTWSTTPFDATTPISSVTATPNNEYFMRVRVNLATTSVDNKQIVIGQLASTLELSSNISDIDNTNDSDSYEIKDIPTAGSFSGF